MQKLMFIAGENSGDQHASRVISELRNMNPKLDVFGYGGERMEASGMRVIVNLAQKFPVIGLTQAIRSYPKLKQLFRRAVTLLEQEKPDALVLVDYPGFNLRLAAEAKRLGIPVIYYISPQIWAWHRNRIRKIAANVDHVIVILPFEEKLYVEAGVPVTYAGHPLQDAAVQMTKQDARRTLKIPEDAQIIGLIPGSRNAEIVRHMPLLVQTATMILRELPDTRFVLPRASTVDPALLEDCLRGQALPITIVEDNSYAAMHSMDFAICKSGTSTLELAIADVPMVIIYKVSLPTYLMAKAVLRIPWIGLVNIVAEDLVAPELTNWGTDAGKISSVVIDCMRSAETLERMHGQLAKVRERLGAKGASHRAADAIFQYLARRSS